MARNEVNLLQSSLWGGGGEEVANEGEKVENHRSEMEDKDSGDEPISMDEVYNKPSHWSRDVNLVV